MQEDNLHREDSTTDDDGGASTRSGSSQAPNANVEFQVDKFEDMSSTDRSYNTSDPVQDLVQFLNKESASISREIDSALSTTEDSDDSDGSFRRADQSWENTHAPEASSLVASSRAKQSDPKHDIKKLNDKVRMLLEDRKIQKQTIDAQKEELASMRAALASSKDEGNSSLETVVVQSELGEARRELVTVKRRVDQLVVDAHEKDRNIASLERRVDGLLKENEAQQKVIDGQNAAISRVSGREEAPAPVTKPKDSLEVNTFEEDFAALDAALGQIENSNTSAATPGSADRSQPSELQAQLAQKDEEILALTNTVKRLESLAFDQSRGSTSSEAGDKASSSAASVSQIRFLKETSDEQARTIQLQKSTIGSLKEEVELLTRQLNDHQSDNHVNVEKQKKVSQNLQKEQQKIAEEAEKLARDKEEFANHLREFKTMRREVLGGAVVSAGGGVSKSRYRTLRAKRDKYKRKDYRKGKEINNMQKRLLQNVELVEVDDSQTSSESQTVSVSASEYSTRSQSSKSVQLVHDTSSEAGESE